MDNLNNPSGVPGESLENSAEAENVNGNPTTGTLAEINQATGRNYATLEDATKGMQETYSFVGNLGEIKDKAVKYDEAQAARTNAQRATDASNDTMNRVEIMEFRYSHPEAKSVEADIQAIAQAKGITMDEAYNQSPMKSFIDKQVQEQAPATGSLAPSGAISGEGSLGPANIDDFNKLPLAEQKKLVGTFTSATQVVGKGIYHSSRRNA